MARPLRLRRHPLRRLLRLPTQPRGAPRHSRNPQEAQRGKEGGKTQESSPVPIAVRAQESPGELADVQEEEAGADQGEG
uniref:Uncharacterized protein n=1 Tax=Arundo donax TaxID=35708 RepID=A0A0A9E5V1_ARUDO